MSDKQTLKHFFSIEHLTKERLSEIARSKEFHPIREKMKKAMKGVPVPAAFLEQMLKQLSDLLHIDIRAILVSAWSKSDEFLDYIDPDKYPPDEKILVPLVEHTITSEHSPSLKSFINQIPIGEIKFHVDLELVLKGVILKIQNGKIMEVTVGSCDGKGEVKVGDEILLERESSPWELPGSIDLGDGIPIQEKAHEFHSIISKIINIAEAN